MELEVINRRDLNATGDYYQVSQSHSENMANTCSWTEM